MAPFVHMFKSALQGYKHVVYFLGPEEIREVENHFAAGTTVLKSSGLPTT